MTPGPMMQKQCWLNCSGQSELGFCFNFQFGARENSCQPPLHGGKELKLESCECSNFPDGGSLSTGRGTKLARRRQHGEKAEVPCWSSRVHLHMKPGWIPTLPAASCSTSWSIGQCTPFVYAHLRQVSVLCIQGSSLHDLKRSASWWGRKGHCEHSHCSLVCITLGTEAALPSLPPVATHFPQLSSC